MMDRSHTLISDSCCATTSGWMTAPAPAGHEPPAPLEPAGAPSKPAWGSGAALPPSSGGGGLGRGGSGGGSMLDIQREEEAGRLR